MSSQVDEDALVARIRRSETAYHTAKAALDSAEAERMRRRIIELAEKHGFTKVEFSVDSVYNDEGYDDSASCKPLFTGIPDMTEEDRWNLDDDLSDACTVDAVRLVCGGEYPEKEFYVGELQAMRF